MHYITHPYLDKQRVREIYQLSLQNRNLAIDKFLEILESGDYSYVFTDGISEFEEDLLDEAHHQYIKVNDNFRQYREKLADTNECDFCSIKFDNYLDIEPIYYSQATIKLLEDILCVTGTLEAFIKPLKQVAAIPEVIFERNQYKKQIWQWHFLDRRTVKITCYTSNDIKIYEEEIKGLFITQQLVNDSPLTFYFWHNIFCLASELDDRNWTKSTTNNLPGVVKFNNHFQYFLDRRYSIGFLDRSIAIGDSHRNSEDSTAYFSFQRSLYDLENFKFIMASMPEIASQVYAYRQRHGKGVVTILNNNWLQAQIRKINLHLFNKECFIWGYWDKKALENLKVDDLILGKNSPLLLKHILLESIDNYNPNSEILVLLSNFAININNEENNQHIHNFGHFVAKLPI